MKLRRLFAHENAGFLRCELTQAQAAGRHVLGVSGGREPSRRSERWPATPRHARQEENFLPPEAGFGSFPAHKRARWGSMPTEPHPKETCSQRDAARNAAPMLRRQEEKLYASCCGILAWSLHTRERAWGSVLRAPFCPTEAYSWRSPQRSAHASTPRGKTFCLLKRYFGLVPAHKRARLGFRTVGSVLPDGSVPVTQTATQRPGVHAKRKNFLPP